MHEKFIKEITEATIGKLMVTTLLALLGALFLYIFPLFITAKLIRLIIDWYPGTWLRYNVAIGFPMYFVCLFACFFFLIGVGKLLERKRGDKS